MREGREGEMCNVPLTKGKQPKAQIGARASKSSAIKGPFELGISAESILKY